MTDICIIEILEVDFTSLILFGDANEYSRDQIRGWVFGTEASQSSPVVSRKSCYVTIMFLYLVSQHA